MTLLRVLCRRLVTGVRRLLWHPASRVARDRRELAESVRHAVDLARLVLRFGQVRRATLHPDGEPESDTTHTVMLALLAVALADTRPDLDSGRVARFALVHDLVEAYSGDVNTARGLDAAARTAKAQREAEALIRVKRDLAGFPALVADLEGYEAQVEPEARWVRYLDKVTPKLTHILNRGRALREIGMTMADVLDSHARQGAELRAEYAEIDLHDFFEAACSAAEFAVAPSEWDHQEGDSE